jgi:hypothetical protein
MQKQVSTFWAFTVIISFSVLVYNITWLQSKLLQIDFDTKYNVAELEKPFHKFNLDLEHTVGVWLCKGGSCIESKLVVDFDSFLKHYNLKSYVKKTEVGKGLFKGGDLKYSEGDPERSYKILSLSRDEMILKDRNPKTQHPISVYTKDHVESSL